MNQPINFEKIKGLSLTSDGTLWIRKIKLDKQTNYHIITLSDHFKSSEGVPSMFLIDWGREDIVIFTDDGTHRDFNKSTHIISRENVQSAVKFVKWLGEIWDIHQLKYHPNGRTK